MLEELPSASYIECDPITAKFHLQCYFIIHNIIMELSIVYLNIKPTVIE